MAAATGYMNAKPSGYDVVQTPQMSPEMIQMIQQLRGKVEPGALGSIGDLSKLAAGGTEDTWKQLEAPALRQFGQLQGNIASRFSGAGMGSRRSSGFQNALSGESTDLAERLQSQRLGLQQGAQNQLMSLYSQLMQMNPYEISLMEKKKKGFSGLNWGGALQGATTGAAAGSAAHPIFGTIGGGILGGALGLFSGKG